MLDPKIHHSNLLTSILAKVEADVAGADDALMLDPAGFVAEINATNVFLVLDGAVLTSTARACPEGIARSTVLDLCTAGAVAAVHVHIGDWSLTDVDNADEVLVTGTMGGLTWVHTVDGRAIGTGVCGPVTAALQAAYADRTVTTGALVV